MKIEVEWYNTVAQRKELLVLPNTLPETMQQFETKFPGLTARVAAFKQSDRNRRKRARKRM